MYDIRDRAIDDMIGRSNLPSDNIRNALLMRVTGNDPDVIRKIMDARASWLTYLTITQSRWIIGTRRPSRARHHDSIAIRERYVRCS